MENKLMKELYQMSCALQLIGDKEKLSNIMIGIGISEEKVLEITAFITERISPKKYAERLEFQAMLAYIEAFKRVENYRSMAKGYMVMGDVNKRISEEMMHLEEEGEKLNEMDSSDTEDKA